MPLKPTSHSGRKTRVILFGCFAACFLNECAQAQLTLFPDRNSFQQEVGTTSAFDNFSSYPLGQLGTDSQLGNFYYYFDTNIDLPMIAADGSGNQVLGGAPYGVFVGGDLVVWINANTGSPLTGFGLDFSYAPAASPIPANTYTITLLDGPAAGRTVGNPALTAAGGRFFLGFLANPGITFSELRLNINQTDPNTLVPACQVNDIVYHNGTVPDLYYDEVQKTGLNVLSLKGGGGLPGGRFFFLSSTNLTLPLNEWQAVTTNYFDSSGNFSLTSLMNQPTEFFLVKPN